MAALLFFIYLVYAPGFAFGIAFDDAPNLEALARVRDVDDALGFALSGDAGPLGRPLSLASFLLNAPSWPDQHADLLRTNALIHLLNVVLVTWLALRLAPLLSGSGHAGPWFALAVGGLWGLSPLLMSASLMAVQRMTTLSATFTFAGVLGYLAARQCLSTRPLRAIAGMSMAVGLGTLTGVLSKEVGALLPLLVAILELTLVAACLPRPSRPALWVMWKLAVFGIPVLWLMNFGWQHLADVALHYQGRGYGPWERILSESRILFAYLRYLLLPQRFGLGPFQDDILLSEGMFEPPVTFLAVAGWVALVALALGLRKGQYRVFAFGIFWFLVGHSLESTIFPLELYFEHRNYVPAFGIVFALVALLWQPVAGRRWPGRLVVVLLLLQAGFVARESGLVWGSPVLAGELWSSEHPRSIRAMMHYSREVAETGNLERAMAIFDGADPAVRSTPEYAAARVQLYCGTRSAPEVRRAQEQALLQLSAGKVDFHVPQGIGLAMQFAAVEKCPGLDMELGRKLLEHVLELPPSRTMARAIPVAHQMLAFYWARKRVLEPTIYHMEQEYTHSGSINAMERLIAVLVSAGMCDAAGEKLQLLRDREPGRALPRIAWQLRLREVETAVESSCSVPIGHT